MSAPARTFSVTQDGRTERVTVEDAAALADHLAQRGLDRLIADTAARAAWAFGTVTQNGLTIQELPA